MLAAKNLEKMIELENNLKAQYQVRLDKAEAAVKAGLKEIADLNASTTKKAESLAAAVSKKTEAKMATIAKQLAQITEMKAAAEESKHADQKNRELTSSNESLETETAEQKKRIKGLQKDLEKDRAEIKALKQFDGAKMKKNLDTSKKKLAEKTEANELLQKTANKAKTENAELTRKVKELEAKIAELEPAEEEKEEAA